MPTHIPHLADEMVSSLEQYQPPLTPEFLQAHTSTPNEVYAAADTLRFALMVYLEIPLCDRERLLQQAIVRRSLASAATGDGQFAISA